MVDPATARASARRDLKPADIVELRGLRVTELALTVVEAAVRRRWREEIAWTLRCSIASSCVAMARTCGNKGPLWVAGRTPALQAATMVLAQRPNDC